MDKGINSMDMTGNLSENWKRWKQKFENYLIASETNKKPERVQCAQLLHFLGEDALSIYDTFKFNDEEKDKLQVLLQKFDDYFIPKQNLTYERYKFLTFKQGNQTFEQFIKELKTRAKQCKFDALTDDLIKTTNLWDER